MESSLSKLHEKCHFRAENSTALDKQHTDMDSYTDTDTDS